MPSRFRPVLSFALTLLALFALTRAALLARVISEVPVSPALLLRVFGFGLAFDLAMILYGCVPFIWLLAAAPERLLRTNALRIALHAFAIAGLFLFCFAALAEWLFWSEFSARFNFIAVDYLVYTREVLGNIRQSYPVAPLLAVVLVAALALWAFSVRAAIEEATRRASGGRMRWALPLAAGLAALACFELTPERPPRIDENRFANELAANGIYNLFSAFRSNELDYAPFYLTEDPADVSRELRSLLKDPRAAFASDDPVGLTRDVAAAHPERPLDVVLIVVESLSAKFLGAFGNREGLTPNLDRLAEEGLLFTNLRATGTRTVRGLEAIALSVPPTPGYSIVKRPQNDNLFSLGTVLREHGYHSRFFYGGYSYFDNMGPFFAGNGFDVIDRSSLSGDEADFANAWGVADEFVFRRVLREARRSHEAGERFLSLVLTTSNHRPFTYPDGRIDIAPGEGRAGAVKYTDWAIGNFIEQARKEEFFADTLFVVVADHCASSAGELDIPVDQYHIPMIVLAPGHVSPGRVDRLASQMDVAPTLLELLGFSYRSRFFGRDILSLPREDERALLGTYQRLGYLKGDMLTVLSPVRRVDVYRIQPNGEQTPVMRRAAGAGVDEAVAYYQSASAAFARSTHQGSD
ncbi:MAG: LTA synthase family protein [Deltaproteobacteria bacterium]|nr:LTA synthase family protein [Deltaproteobacteria bacterium]